MHFQEKHSFARPGLALGALVFALAILLSFGLIVERSQGSTGGIGSTSLADAHSKKKAKKGKRGEKGKGGRRAGKAKRAKRARRRARVAAKYARLWSHVSRRNKRWARRTAECESGGDPKAIGYHGRYRGAFQFMRSTWRTSPKSPGGDPARHTFKTQAYVAVRLKMRDGAHHWPVCG